MPELTTPVNAIAQQDLPRGSGESIDEHLFIPATVIPRPKPAAASVQVPFAPTSEYYVAPPVHFDNVWTRLIDSFELPDCKEHKSSRMWAKWYADHPDYLARVFKRAQPWAYFIAEELELRGMPGELALLPIVESAYDPFAYSSGRALGTWQFISSTAKTYGLKQNWWYDGRRDVWASTKAALDYLEFLDRKFNGDWLLALAGYNSGENRVARRVRGNLAKGKPADFWNIKLPKETVGYVPKLLGLTCLFRDPENYGVELPFTPNQAVIATVKMETQSDLVLVSQISEVSIDVLFSLNPGYNRWATSPDGPWQVVLPIEGADKLQHWLKSENPDGLMKWDQVLVKSGDTISELAARHHLPVKVLRSSNGLTGDLIKIGQKLRLPRDQQLLVDPLYIAAAQELQQLQFGLIASERIHHTIRAGESLSVIADRYKVSVRNLQKWNGITNPNMLRIGKVLTLFHSPIPPKAPPTNSTIKHVVKRGDSLWTISRRYKVKLNDLMRWNDLGKSSVIQPGQFLKVVL